MMSTADTSTASIDERSADAPSLSRQWNSIDWNEAEKNVRHIQGRISKAYSEGRTSLAKRLSYRTWKPQCSPSDRYRPRERKGWDSGRRRWQEANAVM